MALYEIDVTEGLEDYCENILNKALDGQKVSYVYRGALGLKLKDKWWDRLHALMCVNAIYRVERFDVARPKALLGHENFERILKLIDSVRHHYEKDIFQSLGLDAAGEQSAVMQRIKRALSDRLGMSESDVQGDLYVRIRKQKHPIYDGWEVLVRTTPRPLSTRAWRVSDYHGALNGSVANAMIGMLGLTADATLLNIACGSASLMIERYHLFQEAHRGLTLGIDLHYDALKLAQANIGASGYSKYMLIIQGNGMRLPLGHGVIDAIVADLPFGHAVGSHQENIQLYPFVLNEGARLLRHGGKFAILTHEINLMNALLEKYHDEWRIQALHRINLRGLHPGIYILERI